MVTHCLPQIFSVDIGKDDYETCSTAQAFFDAYTAHNVQAMLTFCSPTATLRYIPLGDSGTGSVDETAAGLWQTVHGYFF